MSLKFPTSPKKTSSGQNLKPPANSRPSKVSSSAASAPASGCYVNT